jgi:uncharacterized protein (TIGR00730 family)
MKDITICLFGAASNNIDDIYIHETEALGKEIGSQGYTLLYGGGSTGIMGACSRGVASAGGKVVSVIPTFMDSKELINYNSDEMIWTKNLDDRKAIMLDRSDAFIIAPGGVGTLDEFLQVLTYENLSLLSAPIIIYNINNYFDGLLNFIDYSIRKGFTRTGVRDLFRVCNNPVEAVDLIEYFA